MRRASMFVDCPPVLRSSLASGDRPSTRSAGEYLLQTRQIPAVFFCSRKELHSGCAPRHVRYSRTMNRLREFIREHPRLAVLTGAGVSTGSGIPDYRDEQGEWKCARPDRVERALAGVARADALLVVGSSLTVYSRYRFAETAAAAGKPIAAVN